MPTFALHCFLDLELLILLSPHSEGCDSSMGHHTEHSAVFTACLWLARASQPAQPAIHVHTCPAGEVTTLSPPVLGSVSGAGTHG